MQCLKKARHEVVSGNRGGEFGHAAIVKVRVHLIEHIVGDVHVACHRIGVMQYCTLHFRKKLRAFPLRNRVDLLLGQTGC